MINPATIKIASVAAALSLLAGVGGGYYVGSLIGKASMSEDIRTVEAKLYSCQQTVLTMEQQSADYRERMQIEINQVAKDANKQIEILSANVVTANNAASSLRDKAKRIEDQYRKCANSTKPSADTPEAPYLLADMLGRIDEAAGEIAEYADRVTISNQACVSAYNAK